MAHPLSKFNSIDEDLLFWAKEHLARKAATLSTNMVNAANIKRISALRREIKHQDLSLDQLDEITKEMARLKFKAIRNYAFPAIDFIRYCTSERKLATIKDICDEVVVEDYFGSRYYEAQTTKENHYRAVVSFINYIQRNNYIDQNGASFQFGIDKMPKAYKESKIPDTLLPDEFLTLLEYVDGQYERNFKSNLKADRNKILIKLISYSGVRISELLSLRAKNFGNPTKDASTGEVFIPMKIKGKGNKERYVHIKIIKRYDSNSVSKIGDWLPVREDGLVEIFPELLQAIDQAKDGEKLIKIGEQRAYQIVSEALFLAGIKKGKNGPHLLRHSYATYLRSVGISLDQIQKLLGHVDISTTTIYAKVLDKDIIEAAKRF